MVCLSCSGAGHYYEIKSGQTLLVQAKGLPGQAFDSVAVLGESHIPLGYCQTKSGKTRPVVSSQYDQVII